MLAGEGVMKKCAYTGFEHAITDSEWKVKKSLIKSQKVILTSLLHIHNIDFFEIPEIKLPISYK